MWTTLRRLFWLSAFSGSGFAAWSWYQQRNEATTPPDAPEWPPLDTDVTASAASVDSAQGFAAVATEPTAMEPAAPEPAASEPATGPERWVDPIDGACPDGYPIKANDNSGIYHVPGGRFYNRTAAERCYARAEDAEADGYRASKA